MPLPQQKFREIVCQLIFGLEMGVVEKEDVIPFLTKELKITKKSAQLAFLRACVIFDKKETLDKTIAKLSKDYAIDRIGQMEKSVLRVALFDLLYDKKIPAKVTISEGCRLAKKFSTPSSVKFVNAILDAHHDGDPSLSPPEE